MLTMTLTTNCVKWDANHRMLHFSKQHHGDSQVRSNSWVACRSIFGCMTWVLVLLNDMSAGKTWCVAKSGSSDAALTTGLNFACGPGYANCGPIQAGGSCYQPNTLASHATWAYNDYYRRSGNNYWDCYFNGTAVVTITDPSKTLPSMPTSLFSSPLYANSHRIK